MSIASTCLQVAQIPGPQGMTGAAGTNGTNGANAFTTLIGPFVMPAELGSATANVASSAAFVVGQILSVQFLGVASPNNFGSLEVTAIPATTQVTLKNLKDTPNSKYLTNAAAGTIAPTGSKVTTGGMQGPAGVNGISGAPTDATYLTKTAHAGLSGEIPLNSLAGPGLLKFAADGTPSKAVDGTDFLSPTTGLEPGSNLSDVSSAATSRTNLGLGTMAVQSAAAVAITGGAMNGTLGATTPAAATVTTLSATGNVTHGSKTFLTASATQSLLATGTISPDATKVRVAGNGGAVILTSVPTITDPTADGQLLIIQGTSNTNTVTLQDEGSLAGTRLELGAATRLLGLGDTLGLIWDAATSKWNELFFSNN